MRPRPTSLGNGAAPSHARPAAFRLAHAAWIAIALLLLVLHIAGIPAYYWALSSGCTAPPCLNQQLSPADVQVLAQNGLSLSQFAAVATAFAVLPVVVWSAVAALLFWRKPNDRPALVASFFLLTFPSDIPTVLREVAPAWTSAVNLLGLMGIVMVTLFIYIFPDGHFRPRWTALLALVWIVVWTPGYYFATGSFFDPATWPPTVVFLLVLVWLGSGIGVQVYRYRRVASPAQRQQTKWVVAGTATALCGFVLILSPMLAPWLQEGALRRILIDIIADLCLLLIPLSIGVAIMRAHLYDIDRLISRTLLYSALSATLLAVYVGCVLLLQWLFGAFLGQGSDLAIVVSTLTIAALFQPLRRRFQALIDHRFNRRAYDASQVLAAFSARARDEVELAALARDLVRVIDDTVQPAHIALWLRPQRSDHAARESSDDAEHRRPNEGSASLAPNP